MAKCARSEARVRIARALTSRNDSDFFSVVGACFAPGARRPSIRFSIFIHTRPPARSISTVAGSRIRSSPKMQPISSTWIDRLMQAAKSNQDWNTEAEKDAVLDMLCARRSLRRDGKMSRNIADCLCLNGEHEDAHLTAAFQFQQGFFALDAPAIAAHFSGCSDHAVARDGHRNRIGRASPRHCPAGFWLSDGLRDLSVRPRGAERDRLQLDHTRRWNAVARMSSGKEELTYVRSSAAAGLRPVLHAPSSRRARQRKLVLQSLLEVTV